MASNIDVWQLSQRDQAVVELIGQFKQLTAGHIRDVLFADLASHTPVDRTLKRLVDRSYLVRLQRLVGGDRGGSHQYVYQLGRAGWRLQARPGRHWAPRAVNLHTLAIADCFAALKRAEQAGELEVIRYETEPACHRSVGSVSLLPDLFIEVGCRARGTKVAAWLEVDRATEADDDIQDKCVRYWRAYQLWQEAFYPTVVFVVPDERRVRQVRRVVESGPVDARKLFEVSTFHDFAAAPAAALMIA